MTPSEVEDAYRRYGHLVAGRARAILRNSAAADDVLQEVFVRLLRYGDRFNLAESKLRYLYRIADRCCFDQLARRKRDQADSLGESPRPVSDPIEERDLVLRFLGRFDSRVQQLAVLHFVDEMTHDEIAAQTGWSRQTISKKLAGVRERAAAFNQTLLRENTGGAP